MRSEGAATNVPCCAGTYYTSSRITKWLKILLDKSQRDRQIMWRHILKKLYKFYLLTMVEVGEHDAAEVRAKEGEGGGAAAGEG